MCWWRIMVMEWSTEKAQPATHHAAIPSGSSWGASASPAPPCHFRTATPCLHHYPRALGYGWPRAPCALIAGRALRAAVAHPCSLGHTGMLRRARAPRAPPGPRHFILQLSASRTIVIALLAAVCGIEGGPTAAQLAAVESGDDIPSADSSKSTVVLHAATALETDADLSEPLWIVDMMSRSILKVGGAGQIARLGSHIIDPAMLSAMPSTVAPVWLYEAAPARTRWGELAGHHNNIDRRVHREGCKGQHTGWCTVPHDRHRHRLSHHECS
jgi:hypothetical protein